jgi:outer membrane lipoprotein-sorting protein
VRLKIFQSSLRFLAQIAAAIALCATLAPFATGQNPDTLMPEASTAKAKQILQDLINSFGGPAYLEIQESYCEGRMARFGHNGELTGYTNFKDYWRYPDKNRTDYSKKGVIIDLYNGDKGWTLDRGGVTEQSAPAVADFQEQTKRDINNLLRVRLKEPGMLIRYGGTDIVDLKTVDWLDITDSEQRNFRLAVDRSTHWLARSVVSVEDPDTHQRNAETYIYTNYQLMDSVWTPLQLTLDRNGRRINQIFYQSCKFNPRLPDDLFTRAALDKRFSEVGSKKYKAEKKKEKEQDN